MCGDPGLSRVQKKGHFLIIFLDVKSLPSLSLSHMNLTNAVGALALSAAALSSPLSAAAHDAPEEHAATALRGVKLGQLGPTAVSCVSTAPGSRAKVAEIEVSNDIHTEIKLIAVNNDGSKIACKSPYTGVGVIGDAVDFRLAVDEMVHYVMVLGKGSGMQGKWEDVHEIWRAMDGTKTIWPKTTQIWSTKGTSMEDTELDGI